MSDVIDGLVLLASFAFVLVVIAGIVCFLLSIICTLQKPSTSPRWYDCLPWFVKELIFLALVIAIGATPLCVVLFYRHVGVLP